MAIELSLIWMAVAIILGIFFIIVFVSFMLTWVGVGNPVADFMNSVFTMFTRGYALDIGIGTPTFY